MALEKKMSLAARCARHFDLPAEAMSDEPKVTVSGCSSVLIENHRGLLEYGEERIEVSCGHLRVRLLGEGLSLQSMDKNAMRIQGQIFSVEYE